MVDKFFGNFDRVDLSEFDPNAASITFPYKGDARTMLWTDLTQLLFQGFQNQQQEIAQEQALLKLEASLIETRSQVAALEQTQETQDALSLIDASLKSIQGTQASQTTTISSLSSTLTSLQTAFTQNQLADQTQQQDITNLLSQLGQLQGDEIVDDAAVARLDSNYSALQQALANLQLTAASKEALSTIESQIAALKTGEGSDSAAITQINNSIASLQSTFATENTRVFEAIGQLQTNLTFLQGQETLDDQAISNLETNYSALQHSLVNLQKSAATTTALNQIETDLAALRSTNTTDLNAIRSNITTLQTTLSGITTNDATQTSLINSLQAAQTSAAQAQSIKDASQDALIQQLLRVEVFKKNKLVRVPEDFPTINAAIEEFRNYNCIGCGIDIAPGNYDEYLVLKDIFSSGSLNFNMLSSDVPGVIGTHGLELRARGYQDAAVPSVNIRGLISVIQDLGVYGLKSNLNGITPERGYGFAALAGANLFLYDCQVDNVNNNNLNGNYGEGFSARFGGKLRARRAVARNCHYGFVALRSSFLQAPSSFADVNRAAQYFCSELAAMSVIASTARGTNGFHASFRSEIFANNAVQVGSNTGTGYHSFDSLIHCQNASSDFNSMGYYALYQGMIFAIGATCKRASTNGFLADAGGFIQAASGIAQNNAIAYQASNGSTLLAAGSNVNNVGNTVNYSPATSGAFGNNNAYVGFN